MKPILTALRVHECYFSILYIIIGITAEGMTGALAAGREKWIFSA